MTLLIAMSISPAARRVSATTLATPASSVMSAATAKTRPGAMAVSGVRRSRFGRDAKAALSHGVPLFHPAPPNTAHRFDAAAVGGEFLTRDGPGPEKAAKSRLSHLFGGRLIES